MSVGRAAQLAWSLAGLCLAAVAATFVLVLLGSPATPSDAANLYQGIAAAVAFTLVGAIVATRRSSNPIGWLFIGIGLSGVLGVLTERYAAYALFVEPGTLPGGTVVAWLAAWTWFPAVALMPLALLLFPNGRLLGPRWQAVVWAAAGGLVISTGCLAILYLEEPLASISTEGGEPTPPAAIVITAAIGVTALICSAVAAVVGLVLRWRLADGDERQQFKWVALAAVVFLVSIAFSAWRVIPVSGLLGLIGVVAVPVGAAVAILRYRLYEIDRLINRTLVYGLVTALLALVYAAGVFLLGALLNPAGGSSELAVAASTLAVAALFQPARRRVQAAVDRRFNRRRYDAARTVEAFSARLRDEIDLDTLSAELLAVVNQTMQPTRASLWLRPPTHRQPGAMGTANRANAS